MCVRPHSTAMLLARADEVIEQMSDVAYCEGFRMPAHDDGVTHSGAGVGKPLREETACKACVGVPRALSHLCPKCLQLLDFKAGCFRLLYFRQSAQWSPQASYRASGLVLWPQAVIGQHLMLQQRSRFSPTKVRT